jgi:hypothetical protein
MLLAQDPVPKFKTESSKLPPEVGLGPKKNPPFPPVHTHAQIRSDAETQTHIFELLFTTKAQGKGSGLSHCLWNHEANRGPETVLLAEDEEAAGDTHG